ncbi:phosphatidylserine decarboxylase [Reinekea thalattae]|uniref:Phosphatidylserine decarboxylase proenzyme n=1 Tax=Reinekea thalattae TaxID=2593301 RepID=A0A5C8ZDV9_9GAMM|nr:phosphatidylserine decarboxylase [Reinekea thalattae]
MKNALFLMAQFVLPHHAISRLAGALANCSWKPVRLGLIRLFSKRFKVSLAEAEISNLEQFANFNDFFTRALKPEARPIDARANQWVSPADGVISQLGEIDDGKILQAKQHNYSLLTLLGNDSEMAKRYHNGQFMTVYLSPKDYHRIHIPADATLVKTIHVPGKLYSVNQLTSETVNGLFAKNERLVCEFESAEGRFVMVLVGAMIVASIETRWAGVITPIKKQLSYADFSNAQPISFSKGDEIGRFRLGSTVIVAFEPNAINFAASLCAGSEIHMGQAIGEK